MKILACSYAFAPSVGGIETVTQLLVREWIDLGHEVTVITQIPAPEGNANNSSPFSVVRCPKGAILRKWIHWADVVWCNNISLRYALPAYLSGAKIIVTTQTWLDTTSLRNRVASSAKRYLMRRCLNVAISQAVAQTLPAESVVIGNPFNARQFQCPPGSIRSESLLFVGRLVDDKGAATLLEALSLLSRTGLRPKLTLAGEGPERQPLEKQARSLGIYNQVHFVGLQQGAALAALYHKHQILVVPSLWAEPLGIVALEGLAAGCKLIVSDTGGLPEVAGPQALYFPPGNAQALADSMEQALKSPVQQDIEANRKHLSRFQPRHVAECYLEIFKSP